MDCFDAPYICILLAVICPTVGCDAVGAARTMDSYPECIATLQRLLLQEDSTAAILLVRRDTVNVLFLSRL